jgi:hypothetical protein
MARRFYNAAAEFKRIMSRLDLYWEPPGWEPPDSPEEEEEEPRPRDPIVDEAKGAIRVFFLGGAPHAE